MEPNERHLKNAEAVLIQAIIKGLQPPIGYLKDVRGAGWASPARCRVVAAAYLVRGRLAEAEKWARRAAALRPAVACTWRLLVAVADAQSDRVRLLEALGKLAQVAPDAQAVLAEVTTTETRTLPTRHRAIIARSTWFDNDGQAEPASASAPREADARVSEGLTHHIDSDAMDLLEAVNEAVRHRSTDAASTFAELILKLQAPLEAVGGRPRGLVGWLNQRRETHIKVPEEVLVAACVLLQRKGVADWSSAEGILRIGSNPLQAPPIAPVPPLTLSTLILPAGGTLETKTLTIDRVDGGLAALEALAEVGPGALLGKYKVESLAGHGGMGNVWKATLDGRTFAIKTVRTRRESARRALRRELELLSKINRADFFPTVHEYKEDGDQHYVVMDWVNGQTLKDWVHEAQARRLRDLDARTFEHILTQIADRLTYLHTWPGDGILFRDLKPSNIMIEPGLSVKLVDFGISHLGDPEGQARVQAGSHGYLAPEVEAWKQADRRTDVFSLGRVALFLLFGHEDFERVLATSLPILHADRGLGPAVVRTALELADPDPLRRPPDCAEALRRVRFALSEDSALDAPDAGDWGSTCRVCERSGPERAAFCPWCGVATRQERLLEQDQPRAAVRPLTRDALPVHREVSEVYQRLILSRAASDITKLRCRGRISVQPYEYQEQAAVHVISALGGKALLADDVGLGKTVEAGLVIAEQLARGLTRRVLIVSPPGVLLNQIREEMREKFKLDFKKYIPTGDADPSGDCVGPKGLETWELVIVSKALVARKNYADLLRVDWDTVVVDECHHFTNYKANGYQHLRRLSAKAQSILLMSATPFRGDPEQLWALFSLLDPGVLGHNVDEFRRRFVEPRWNAPPAPTREFKDLVSRYTIRRRRGDIGGGISFPGRDAVRVAIPMDPGTAELHRVVSAAIKNCENQVLNHAVALQQLATSYDALRVGATMGRLSPEARDRVGRLSDVVHPKVQTFLERVLPRLPADEKVLVFTHFRESQRVLLDLIRKRGFGALGLLDQSSDSKVETVRRFKVDPGIRVLVCGEGAGEGLNLQFCSVLVNFDLPWNPMRLEQRIGRIQRLGQKRKRVSVVNLVLADTIEDRVLEILTNRLEMFRLFMGETEQVLGKLLEQGDSQGSLEAWIAGLVLSNGRVDDDKVKALGQQFGDAVREVREGQLEGKEDADRWIGLVGPTASSVPPPTEEPLSLDDLLGAFG